MKKNFFLIIAFILVIVNGFIGRFGAPSGIIFTPIVIIITTSFILFGTDYKGILKCLLSFSLIALNDIFIKLYSGGKHDSEGLIWVNTFLWMGIIPSYIILLYSILKNPEESIFEKTSSLILFPILIFTYLHFFYKLGLGRYYPI